LVIDNQAKQRVVSTRFVVSVLRGSQNVTDSAQELRRRQWRPPDYKKENRALVTLASALADPQSNILQTLAETILDVTQCVAQSSNKG
jgi:hypothetical protein